MTAETENERDLSRQAMAFMEQHQLAPTPEHYALWFQYAAGKNRELTREIDRLVKSDGKVSKELCRQLHIRYIVADRNQIAVDEAAAGAQKVLQEVLKVVTEFSGETKHYNDDVDQYLDKITHSLENNDVKQMVKSIIQATATLKESGSTMSQKLEESTLEISHLKKDLQQVTVESQRDFLTSVYNRKAFEKLFEEHAEGAKLQHSELCLMMIDIDHFKRFNDKFGHLLGDEVLKIVARTMTEILKGRDIVARFGGEEFVVVLPETPAENAVKVAEMIRTAIATKELKRKDTGENYGTITVSIGVARFHPEKDNLAAVVKRADDALYQSKHQGRNRVTKIL